MRRPDRMASRRGFFEPRPLTRCEVDLTPAIQDTVAPLHKDPVRLPIGVPCNLWSWFWSWSTTSRWPRMRGRRWPEPAVHQP
jgi:hypothetical protein